MQVIDKNGASRRAPLFYVSDAQINGAVPAGTAPGRAQVEVVQPAGTQTAATTIVPVVPVAYAGDTKQFEGEDQVNIGPIRQHSQRDSERGGQGGRNRGEYGDGETAVGPRLPPQHL